MLFEEIDGVKKGTFADCDNEVDGIEIFVAAEAASEIGVGVNGGIEFIAYRAKET